MASGIPDSNWSSGFRGVGWYLPDLLPFLSPEQQAAIGVPKLDPTTDATYVAQQSAGTTGLNDTYAGLGVGVNPDGTINYQPSGGYGGQYLQTTQATGFDENGNPITDPSDPRYNPFSALKIFQQNFENTKRGTTNSYANSGQLYAGSLVNAQNTNQHNYDVGYDQMARGSKSDISKLVANALSGKDTFASTSATQLGDAANRQAANPPPFTFPKPPAPPKVPKPKVISGTPQPITGTKQLARPRVGGFGFGGRR